jgi:hypothetical protein
VATRKPKALPSITAREAKKIARQSERLGRRRKEEAQGAATCESLPISLWLAVSDFVSFLQRPKGRHYVDGGLGMRDTSLELSRESSYDPDSVHSRDWTFEFELYDDRTKRRTFRQTRDRGRPAPDERYFRFWFVLAPLGRDSYDRYQPKQKSIWETHQRPVPIHTFRDVKEGVQVDVYETDPWKQQSLRINPRISARTFAGCSRQISWWIAMADFAKWSKRSAANSSVGGVVDYVSAWNIRGSKYTDPCNFLEIGEYQTRPVDVGYRGSPGGTSGRNNPIAHFWALNSAPSAYFIREGEEANYKDPLWNSANGELWIYDYDPWDVLMA